MNRRSLLLNAILTIPTLLLTLLSKRTPPLVSKQETPYTTSDRKGTPTTTTTCPSFPTTTTASTPINDEERCCQGCGSPNCTYIDDDDDDDYEDDYDDYDEYDD